MEVNKCSEAKLAKINRIYDRCLRYWLYNDNNESDKNKQLAAFLRRLYL